MSVVTNQPLQLSNFVRDISTAVASYNRLRWHRSADGEFGTYVARTQAAAAPAVLTIRKTGPHQLNGKTLSLMIGGVNQVDVVFATADPVSATAAAAEIDAASALFTAVALADETITITNAVTGTGSSIEVLGGDANAFLGLTQGDGALGVDADTVLVAGTHEYFFTDQNSNIDYWYRVEFLNTATGATTGLGVPFPALQSDQVPVSQTIVAYIRLADLSGHAIEGRRVTLSNAFLPNVVSGFGLFRHSLELTTDRNGYAETRVVRGADVDVSIDGTGFVRRITIPTTGDAVDLLDASLVAADEFGVQQMNVDFAIRTS